MFFVCETNDDMEPLRNSLFGLLKPRFNHIVSAENLDAMEFEGFCAPTVLVMARRREGTPIPSLLESSIILDELYNHPPVEFFIFIGSLSGQFGHANTVECAAASEFSSALIHWRRSRGFCGSIVFLSQIPDPTSESKFLGERYLSEHNLDEVLAEAILPGDPNST